MLIWYTSNRIARKDATRPKCTCYNEIRHIEIHLSAFHLNPFIACSIGKEVCTAIISQHTASFEPLFFFSLKCYIFPRFSEGKLENMAVVKLEGVMSQIFNFGVGQWTKTFRSHPDKRLNKDVNLDNWAALKVTPLSGR